MLRLGYFVSGAQMADRLDTSESGRDCRACSDAGLWFRSRTGADDETKEHTSLDVADEDAPENYARPRPGEPRPTMPVCRSRSEQRAGDRCTASLHLRFTITSLRNQTLPRRDTTSNQSANATGRSRSS